MIRRSRHCSLLGVLRGGLRRRAELSAGGRGPGLHPGRCGALERRHPRVLRLARRGPGRATRSPRGGRRRHSSRASCHPTRLAGLGVARHLPRLDAGRAGPDGADARIAISRPRSAGSRSSAPTWASRGRRSFPSVTANGSESTNQVAFGSFPPTSYDALRFTGDLAWELDFWGRIRRGVEAARADLARRRRRNARWCCRW